MSWEGPEFRGGRAQSLGRMLRGGGVRARAARRHPAVGVCWGLPRTPGPGLWSPQQAGKSVALVGPGHPASGVSHPLAAHPCAGLVWPLGAPGALALPADRDLGFAKLACARGTGVPAPVGRTVFLTAASGSSWCSGQLKVQEKNQML